MKTINFQRLILTSLVFLCAHTAKAQVTIGSEIDSPAAALLNIQDQADSNPSQGGITAIGGGVLLPRVVLEETTSLKPFLATGGTSAEKAAHKGMNVYNIGGNGIDPGQYVWDGSKWLLLLTDVPAAPITQLNLRDLQSTILTTNGDVYGNGGSVLNFGSMTIQEDGSYAFSFRFYGRIQNVTAANTWCIYYLAVLADGVVQDIAEIAIYAQPTIDDTPYTYSVTLGYSATAGQNVTFSMSHGGGGNNKAWSLHAQPGTNAAARTSMIWWKL